MEDTLREHCIGYYQPALSLNPCFNGRYSQRYFKQYLLKLVAAVLILVLMEDTLRENNKLKRTITLSVLILVLMEDTLRVQRLVSLCISSFDVCLPLWK